MMSFVIVKPWCEHQAALGPQCALLHGFLGELVSVVTLSIMEVIGRQGCVLTSGYKVRLFAQFLVLGLSMAYPEDLRVKLKAHQARVGSMFLVL